MHVSKLICMFVCMYLSMFVLKSVCIKKLVSVSRIQRMDGTINDFRLVQKINANTDLK